MMTEVFSRNVSNSDHNFAWLVINIECPAVFNALHMYHSKGWHGNWSVFQLEAMNDPIIICLQKVWKKFWPSAIRKRHSLCGLIHRPPPFFSSVCVHNNTRKTGEKRGRPGSIHHVNDVRWTRGGRRSQLPKLCTGSSVLVLHHVSDSRP